MRHIFLLLLLLPLVARAASYPWETEYVAGRHYGAISINIDDRLDTTYVGVAEEHGVYFEFSPFRLGAIALQDYDSTFAKGKYGDEMIKWARLRGHRINVHAQPRADAVVFAGGLDSLRKIWDAEEGWVRRNLPMQYRNEKVDFTWVGHINGAQMRTYAMQRGSFSSTRGDGGYSRDLYLPYVGWESLSGAGPYPPIPMQFPDLFLSASMYRTNTGGVVTQDTTAALDGDPYTLPTDTTGHWNGAKNFARDLLSKNGYAVLNPHPAWISSVAFPFGETIVDTFTWTDKVGDHTAGFGWVSIPNDYDGNPDSIRYMGRQGHVGRNDTNPYVTDYVLHAFKWIADSIATVDSLDYNPLCITTQNQMAANASANLRHDVTHDYTAVADTNAYWESTVPGVGGNDGLFALNPGIDRNKIIYVDGTQEVKAGNGTAEFPLPWYCINHLFNCKIVITGHEVGDTLVVGNDTEMFCGNWTLDGQGITIVPTAAGNTALFLDGNSYYHHGIQLLNLTLDGLGTSATDPILLVGSQTVGADSNSIVDMLLKGVTVHNSEVGVYLGACVGAIVDSCFFRTGGADLFTNGSNVELMIAGAAEDPLVRNSFFDTDSLGGATGTGSTAAIKFPAAQADSGRVLNCFFKLGSTGSRAATDRHRALYTTLSGAELKLRFEGNYIVNNNGTADPADIWKHHDGTTYRELSMAELADSLDGYGSGFTADRVYEPGAWAGFDYTTQSNDTLRLAGYTGEGSLQTGMHASIGTIRTADYPRVRVSPVPRSGIDANVQLTLHRAADLFNKGLLAPADSNDISTWFPVSVPRTDGERAQWEYLLSQYEAFPDSTKQRLKLTVKD